jgi:hypothetical protein
MAEAKGAPEKLNGFSKREEAIKAENKCAESSCR